MNDDGVRDVGLQGVYITIVPRLRPHVLVRCHVGVYAVYAHAYTHLARRVHLVKVTIFSQSIRTK